MTREIRTMACEIREVAGKERTFSARICNYGVADSYNTSWAPGVFTRSLSQRLPKAVWSHDWERPIGKVVGFTDGPEGLDVEVQLADFDAVPDARMAHSLLKDGIIDNFSFGFVRKADEDDPDLKGPKGERVKRILDVDLDEVSPVLVGAVPGTRTLSVRSDEQVSVRAAADILVKFGAGELDLADALTELKNGNRALMTEASLPKNSAGGLMTTKAHPYKPTAAEGSKCLTCGDGPSASQHTNRSEGSVETPEEIAAKLAADNQKLQDDAAELHRIEEEDAENERAVARLARL